MRLRKKMIWPFLLLCCWPIRPVYGAENADFAVADMAARADGFVHILLQNLSGVDVVLSNELKEAVFLAISIDNIVRGEYKIKYLEPALFKKHSSLWFRTNFRPPEGDGVLNMKAEINGRKVIPETNRGNNVLEKQVKK